jgi:hypothetical protein
MTVRQIALLGDSTTQGTQGGFNEALGALGSWADLITDRLSNIAGLGPLISSGFRGTHLGRTASGFPSEWTVPAVTTATVSTDLFDRYPYGVGTYSNGPTKIWTYTKPSASRPIIGFALYWIDKTSGGNWQYRVDGGTWLNMNQTIANDNQLKKFYLATAVASTVDIRASSDATTGVDAMPAGIEVYYVDPLTATTGLIVHNLGVNASKLDDMVKVTSGDRMAILDDVRLGTGSPKSPTPNAGVIVMHINDTLLASTATWDADLTTLHTRAVPLCPVGYVNIYEADTAAYNVTQQTNYRAHTKTTAAGFSPASPVLDLYDTFANLGFTGNAATNSGGYLLDLTHESQLGHQFIADRVYWWVRNNFFTIGKAGSIVSVGSSPLGSATALLGGQVEIIVPDAKTVTATPGTAAVKATNTIAATGKQIAVTVGAPTIHATRTISPTGVAVAATAGAPLLRPGALTLAPSGKSLAATAGSPALRAANTIAATGKAITVTPGTASLSAHYALLPAGKALAATAGSPTIHAAYTILPAGKAIAVTPGASAPTSPNVILASAGYSQAIAAGAPTLLAGAVRLLPSGKAVAATAGAPVVHASNVLHATGQAIGVTPGAPTTHSTATLHPTGLPVASTPGSPAMRSASTIIATGKSITATAGAPSVRSTRTLAPVGVAVTTTAGAATIAPGAAYIHPTGVAVLVLAGAPSFSGGQGEPSVVTVAVVPTMRATVAVLPHATATVSV